MYFFHFPEFRDLFEILAINPTLLSYDEDFGDARMVSEICPLYSYFVVVHVSLFFIGYLPEIRGNCRDSKASLPEIS